MRLLCLDLGSTVGFADRCEDGISSGFVGLKGGRYEGGGMRYLRFRQWLNTQASNCRPDIVYFEEVRRHLGTDAAHVYGGLLATLTAWCEEQKIPYRGVPVGTIKKTFTGKGNASKDEMINAACHHFKRVVTDDNEADALGILYWASKNG
jgi:crossover junction endodeoxyribonuclease RuvC